MTRRSSKQGNLDQRLEQRARVRAIRRERRKKREKIKKIIIITLILILTISLFLFFKNSTEREITKMTNAIKTNDMTYLNKKMDRMGSIMEVLGQPYSEDDKEADEFLKNNFKNLTIDFVDEKKTDMGREVTLDITNVNYIDIYNSLGANPSHKAYMEKLAGEGSQKNKSTVQILIKKSIFKNQIYESRSFVNAILGKALDYAKD